MKLIDAERLEKELINESSGYNERAKTILWGYQKILHGQQDLTKWIFMYGIICSGIGYYLGKYSG